MPKFNKDVFVCAAEAVDCGCPSFEFSCNALYFVASGSSWLSELRRWDVDPVMGRDRTLAYKYEDAYGQLMKNSSYRITSSDVRCASEGDKDAMREHRVLMLLLAGEVLGGKEIQSI